MIKNTSSILIALFISVHILAQDSKQLRNTFREAEYFFMKEDYSEALNLYLLVYSQKGDNENLAFRIGVCCLNIPGKKETAVKYLESAVKNMSAKRKEGTLNQVAAPYDALYELARAYRISYNFDKAKEYFIKYKSTLLADDKENLDFIDHEISVCETARNLIEKPISFSEENVGKIVNDDKSNFNPVISADGKTFAFMSSLKFYDAIMVSLLQNDKWTDPINIYPDLQIDGDISISSLSRDGHVLYLSRDDNYGSDIYSSTFNNPVWSPAVLLNKNINTRYWESHAFISEDGNLLIFSSDRPGGYGGLDLYMSRKENGDWGPAINMGPGINTKYNEDRPFLGDKDRILIFCSQGHENIGGYDLFISSKLSDGSWGKPVNMGYPLNTPDDNYWYMTVNDGRSGYIFKDSETSGYGKDDIYKIILK